MFAGASNVKVFGGSFRTVNGNYYHHEHQTNVTNTNSNNVIGNTLTESHVDNSQVIYGANAKGRAYARSMRRGPNRSATEVPTHDDLSPTLQNPSNAVDTIPRRTQTQPWESLPAQTSTSSPVINHHPLGLLQDAHHQPTRLFSSFNPGDVRGLNPVIANHLSAIFLAMDQENELQPAYEDSRAQPILGSQENPIAIDDEPDSDDEYASSKAAHVRGPSPPTAMMQYLSLDDPSLYVGVHAESTETQGTASASPPMAAVSGPQHFFSQSFNPSSTFSNVAHTLRSTVESSINDHSASQPNSFAGTAPPAPSTSSAYPGSGFDYTAFPTATSPINALTTGHMTFNGNYTEINHNTRTMNYEGSGIVSNNTIQTIYQGTKRTKEEPEAEGAETPRSSKQGRNPGRRRV